MNAGEIHVWRVALDRIPPGPEWLTSEEQERASRFHFARHALAFRACRGALRRLLGQYAGLAPESIQFTLGPHGKPAAEGAPIEFNVSHTEGLALIALCAGAAIGVDIEWTGRLTDTAAIARYCFSPGELADLSRREPEAFYDYWTAKEACIKAEGGGLSIALDGFTVAPEAAADGWREVSGLRWRVRTFEAGAGYRAALAAPPGAWQVIDCGWSG